MCQPVTAKEPCMRGSDLFMGEIVEVGSEVRKVKKGDRVIVLSFICCGSCWYCEHDLWALWDNTNPNAALQEPLLGLSNITRGQ